ncbi:MAG: hypothetical protein PHI31_11865 [Desulfuromonadaceae bacterium]|nr:hypothetical protein [Desulfuromonadaceae bacterium]
MEIFGGFMVMMSIMGFFLAVVWLIMPFVVFAVKGKQDRTLDVLEAIEKRLAVIEAHMSPVISTQGHIDSPDSADAGAGTSDMPLDVHHVLPTDVVTDKNSSEC